MLKFSFCTQSSERPYLQAGKAILTMLGNHDCQGASTSPPGMAQTEHIQGLICCNPTSFQDRKCTSHLYQQQVCTPGQSRRIPLMQRWNSRRILHPYYKLGARRETTRSIPLRGATAYCKIPRGAARQIHTKGNPLLHKLFM